MKYCSSCGSELNLRLPEGDNRMRHVCEDCGEIHYRNPKVVTGCIPEWEDKILLCRRSIEPRYGYWTLPAGFMENGETVQEGAARETLEEANARVRVEQLYTTFNLPHINQIYMLFRGKLLDLDFFAGDESLEVSLFTEQEVAWEELAFPVVVETLRLYFKDRLEGVFQPRIGDIRWISKEHQRYEVEIL